MHTTGHSQEQHTPWVAMPPAQQRAFLSSLPTKTERRLFLESEANKLLSDGHSENYQGNADFRATHADGRPLFDEFDGNKNNSDDGEPSELGLDGLQIFEEEADGEGTGEAPSQEQETALASSWADCATEESRWGKNEWNAVLALSAPDMKNRDVLNGLARGMSVADIAAAIGRTKKQAQNNIRWLWKEVRGLDVADIVRHLDDPDTTEPVTRRPPSRAGRKPKGWVAPITTAIIISFDLFGDPIQPCKPRKPRKAGARRPRVRRVRLANPLQMSLFDMAA